MITKVKARIGRPRLPPSERLVAYGLHLSPDKKDKLFSIKTTLGVSVREWVEGKIEKEFVKLSRAKTKAKTAASAARGARARP